ADGLGDGGDGADAFEALVGPIEPDAALGEVAFGLLEAGGEQVPRVLEFAEAAFGGHGRGEALALAAGELLPRADAEGPGGDERREEYGDAGRVDRPPLRFAALQAHGATPPMCPSTSNPTAGRSMNTACWMRESVSERKRPVASTALRKAATEDESGACPETVRR